MMRRNILKRRAHSSYGKINVPRANLSSGKGFEIGHFVVQGLKSKACPSGIDAHEGGEMGAQPITQARG
jgi:hypothetical protein